MTLANYEFGDVLGSGAFGETTAATRCSDGLKVAIKELRLRGLPDWKPFERFEREAKTLRSIDHPSVVRFVDAFDEEREGERVFFIVSERIEGKTLGEEIEGGRRWSEAEARALFERLLEALHYLHSLSPQVLHRDIKPSNIMLRDDGLPVLIDFGAVADLGGNRADGGVTVMGTAGYMPPEQAMGKPSARSDLYGLGATMIHVLSHEHPSTLVDEDLRIGLPETLGIAEKFAAVLERLVEPSLGDRYESAAAVLEALADPKARARPAEARLAAVGPSLPAIIPPAPRELTAAVMSTLTLGRDPRGKMRALISSAIGGLVLAAGMILRAPLLMVPFAALALVGLVLVPLMGARNRARQLYAAGLSVNGRVVSAKSTQEGQTIITYAYEVDGHSYTRELATTNALALQGIEKGSPVAVFYDEDNPQSSTALLPRELPESASN